MERLAGVAAWGDIAEYDGNNRLLRKYLHGPGIDQPICMIDANDPNGTCYYHYDGLGSCIALSDPAGEAAVLYEYSIYGQAAASDPNHPNPFLFTGREFDKETGLYYYRARYYNATIGRFLQTDPAGQGMNPYVYCGNNSTNCVDPSGMIGRFLDSTDGMLQYEAENGEITEFTDLGRWMDWFESDIHGRGTPLSSLAGYKMAGGDANLNLKILWNIQALIALGFSEGNMRELDDTKLNGTTQLVIACNSKHLLFENLDDSGNWVVNWDPSGDFWSHDDQSVSGVGSDWHEPHWMGFPALAVLAHELTHAYQRLKGKLVGYDYGNAVAMAAEQEAMMVENKIAYAFYTNVPGYGKGGVHEIAGPRTYYKASGESWAPIEGGGTYMGSGKKVGLESMQGMTWGQYWIRVNEGYRPAY